MRIIIKKLLKAILLEIIVVLIYTLLKGMDALVIFNNDIEFFELDEILKALGGIIIVSIALIITTNNINSLHNWVKKHYYYLIVINAMGHIVILYKSNNITQTIMAVIEALAIWISLDCEVSKIYKYNLGSCSREHNCYVEKPIVGRDNLTSTQKEALDKLKLLINKRYSYDSFNVALVGAWGTGKTSIIDTLIDEYEKIDNYFILKIGTLTLRESGNIAEYVRNYFEDLFRRYEIGIPIVNVAFLTSIVNILTKQKSWDGVLNIANNTAFFDLEKEKKFFSDQVARLLKVAGKKNVLLFIDDMERSGEEEQIIKLLLEFASINGIISVISMSKCKDIWKTKGGDDENVIYSELDKYIHIRIKIDEDYKIEYNKTITNQLIHSYNNLQVEECCYIACDGQNGRKSMFDIVRDYQTCQRVDLGFIQYNRVNILTTLFFENLKVNGKNFGEYFQEVVNEYMYRTSELWPHITKMISCPMEQWSQEICIMNAQWTDSFAFKEFDWTKRLLSNANTMFFTLCELFNAINMIINIPDVQSEIRNVYDAYDYYMINKFPTPDRTWDNRNENKVMYSGLDQIELLVYGNEEYSYINGLISQGEFLEVRNSVKQKLGEVLNLFLGMTVLENFITFIRGILNNIRSFKMQLREADLLNVNYLDYIMDEWQYKSEIHNILDKIKEDNPVIAEINPPIPSISALFNGILFEYYINKYGDRFINEELKDRRLFLVKTTDRLLIAITEEKNKDIIILNINGEIVNSISAEEQVIIEEKNKIIWNM